VSWFRLDDKSWSHPKIVEAGNAAWGALCRMGAYASDHLTDGVIPSSIAQLIATVEETERLVATGILIRREDGAYEIHDYLRYNPRGRDVRKLREERAKAGARGAQKTNGKRPAKVPANTSAIAAAKERQPSSNGSPRPDPVPIPIPERAEDAARAPTPPIPIPQPISASSELSSEMHEYAAMQGLADIKLCWEKFLGLSAERGKRTSDLFGSWKRFVADEVRYQRRDRDRAAERGGPAEPKKQAAYQPFTGHK